MWLFCLFLLLFVSPRVVRGSNCLAETLKCSRLRPTLHAHKNLLVSRREVNEMCTQQDQFYKCLDNMEASGVMEMGLPSSLQHAKTLLEDLCLNASSLQTQYLELAPCINRQYTEFCTDPEFLGAVKLGDKHRNKCSLHQEAVNCIAATLSMNCGMEAGRLFHHLLKMTSDGGKNCYALGSEILFLPTVQETRNDEKVKAYSKVYRGLLRRIGSIPEQDESMVHLKPTAANAFTENITLDTMDTASEFLAELPSIPSSEESPMLFDAPYTVETPIFPQEKFHNIAEELKARNLLHVVRFHTNTSVSEYTRYAGFRSIEGIFCNTRLKAGKKVCECTYIARRKNPECIEGGRNDFNMHDPIIPEDIDPDLGAKLYTTVPYAYYFKPTDMHGSTRKLNLKERKDSTTENLRGLSNLYGAKDSAVTPKFNFSYKESEDSSDNSKDQDRRGRSSKYNFRMSLANPIHSHLAENYVTALTTLRSPRKAKRMGDSLEPSDLDVDEKIFGTKRLTVEQAKLLKLLEEVDYFIGKQRLVTQPNMKYQTPFILRITVDAKENSRFLNMTCGRVNECHPNATDIHRCLYHFSPEK